MRHNLMTSTKKTLSSSGKNRWAELAFIRELVKLNLASAMEYRASFISQIVGMMLNNGIMLLFWLIFFEQFGAIRGYDFEQVFMLYGIVAFAYGLAHILAGNTGFHLAGLIAQGRLDYYLVFPRRLLPHVVLSRMQIAAIGDLTFGLLVCVLVVPWQVSSWLTVLSTAVLAGIIMVSYATIAGSLSFFFGNAQHLSYQMTASLVTFALYPNTLFSGAARLMLFTLIPAGFVGAVPVALIQSPTLGLWLVLITASVVSVVLATAVFYLGLRRYESGSAINVNV